MKEPAPDIETPPARTLSVADTVFVIVGLVLGAGIFKAPSLVAAQSGSDAMFMLLWLAGGAIALIGALCYAELASAFPNTGGDYHFLRRAFGNLPAFLFGWARMTVLQTGSIALLAYVFGDYVAQLAPIAGGASATIYALLAIAVFTLLNLRGIREAKGAQRLLTLLEIGALLAICGVVLAWWLGRPDAADAAAAVAPGAAAASSASAAASGALATSLSAIGLAMVFVLLTFGGWNEAAYVSAEVQGRGAPILRALLIGIAVLTGLYLLVNLAYLAVLGREGMAASEAVAADAMRALHGEAGVAFVSLAVGICALTSINATIITGARSTQALGRDHRLFGKLGSWDTSASTPRNALLLQAAISMLLVAAAATQREAFAAVVEYTAPVFWLFFLLTGVALFRLRRTEPDAARPFRVPLYPLVPLLFCASSAGMLWSSLSYTGRGAWLGVAVLLAGLPLYALAHRRERDQQRRRLAPASEAPHP